MFLRSLICGPWREKYEISQRALAQKTELLKAQVLLTEAALHVGDGERALKQYYMDQTGSLTSLLDKAFKLPLYGDYADDGVPVDPWNHAGLAPYLKESLDAEYLALPFEDWSTMLTGVYDSMKETLGRWMVDIYDCDDFALSFHAFVSLVCRDSGFPKQAAFAVARSPTHAYNVFITYDGGVWVFEPQSGKAVGKLGETVKPYDTIRVYFLS